MYAIRSYYEFVAPAAFDIGLDGADEVLGVLGGQVGHAGGRAVAVFSMAFRALCKIFPDADKGVFTQSYNFV